MSYTPSLMHIISAERRIANECDPEPRHDISDIGASCESVYTDKPLQNPIQSYNIQTLELVKEYLYIKDMDFKNVVTIRQRAKHGYISENLFYVRKKPFEALSHKEKALAVQKFLQKKFITSEHAVIAQNIKTGVLHNERSVKCMAAYLEVTASTLSMYINKKIVFHDWEVWHANKEKPVFMTKKQSMGLSRGGLLSNNFDFKSKVKKTLTNKGRPVALLNIKTKETLRFNSAAAAARAIEIGETGVRVSCKKGYILKNTYKAFYIINNELVNPFELPADKRKQKKSVKAINNLTGECIEFENVKKAADFLDVGWKSLANCARNGYNCKNHKVFLVLDGEVQQPKVNTDCKKHTPIIVYNDKEEKEFSSQTAFARSVGVRPSVVNRAINTGKIVKGYKIRSK